MDEDPEKQARPAYVLKEETTQLGDGLDTRLKTK